jgi:hypothetical protein
MRNLKLWIPLTMELVSYVIFIIIIICFIFPCFLITCGNVLSQFLLDEIINVEDA